MDKYPFTNCLNPQHIRNPHTGESLIVGCGKCEACLLQKSSMRALKCKLESMSHKHTLFVSLTFADEFLPKMMPFHPNDITNHTERKKWYFFDATGRTMEGEILSENFLSLSELSALQKKCNLGEALPWLCKRDLQLFMKRLRKKLSKYTDEKIRYYAVGEYGPVHFRPHFHIMLWFSEGKTAEKIHEAIHQSWTYGRIDIQESQGKCASYIAGYLNGSCNLPGVFKSSQTAPFACHSRFLGEKVLRSEKEEVYKMPVEKFIKRCLNLDGTNSEFSLWRSFKTAYFPRCTGYASLTHSERYRSYTSYAAASEVCRETSPYRQAKEIVDNVINGDYDPYCLVYHYFIKKYNLCPYVGPTMYEKQIRQVYMELRTSEHFLNFVCDGIDNALHQNTMLYMIEHFYDKVTQLGLAEQLITQNEFLKYDSYDIDDWNYIYWNKPFDETAFKNNIIYKKFKEKTLLKARDSVKHKTLNDQNKIFCY